MTAFSVFILLCLGGTLGFFLGLLLFAYASINSEKLAVESGFIKLDGELYEIKKIEK